MGLLALHLLTDIGNFIIPYIINLKDHLYFKQLGPGHSPFFTLLLQDLKNLNILESTSITAIYILNIIAMLFFLLLPTFLWYVSWKKKQLQVSKYTLAIIVTAIITFILSPTITIKKIIIPTVVGVDMVTNSPLIDPSWFYQLIGKNISASMVTIGIALLMGALVYVLEEKKKIKKMVFLLTVCLGILYFGYYVTLFFLSLITNYWIVTNLLIQTKLFFLAFFFLLFGLMNILLYCGGYLLFIYEVIKNHLYEE